MNDCSGNKGAGVSAHSSKLIEYDKGNYHPKNKLNDLTGAEWVYFTKTILKTSYPSEYGHTLRKAHGANKPPQLMKELIEFFTKKGQIVLDPFAGVGGTLIGASLSGRKGVGIEINKKWIDIYNKVCEKEGIEKQEMIEGDCLEEMDKFDKESFDYIVIDPPYNLSFKRTMCDSNSKYKEWRNRATLYNDDFSDDLKDFANLPEYEDYLDAMEGFFKGAFRLLVKKKYLTLIVRDAYQEGRYILTSYDLAHRAEKVGFTLKGDKIWYQTGARLRPYGYPFSYVPNLIHQHILIFRKQ